MGYTSYNATTRSARATTKGYATGSLADTFVQQKVGLVHEGLSPKGLVVRECCDSEAHPNSIPILLGLDVTGSMGYIPHQLVKEGLPTLMTTLIDSGLPDASLCFAAVGDHFTDSGPFQISQFESGDAELDDWLTKTWIEGNGGGNGGESYMLPWYAAANHVKTDSFDKRGQKGFIITIGNEPVHSSISKNAIENIFGSSAIEGSELSTSQILAEARKKWNVFHIHVESDMGFNAGKGNWKELLGENLITVSDFKTIPQVIADLVLANSPKESSTVQRVLSEVNDEQVGEVFTETVPVDEEAIML